MAQAAELSGICLNAGIWKALRGFFPIHPFDWLPGMSARFLRKSRKLGAVIKDSSFGTNERSIENVDRSLRRTGSDSPPLPLIGAYSSDSTKSLQFQGVRATRTMSLEWMAKPDDCQNVIGFSLRHIGCKLLRRFICKMTAMEQARISEYGGIRNRNGAARF